MSSAGHPTSFRDRTIGYMLAHEQFRVPELTEIGRRAVDAGFGLLATSDHFQPWQANQGHSGLAWITMGALGDRARSAWIGTTVTCPTLRYHPAIVAEAFATLAQLYPGRVFLGVGSGEALNEQAATGEWPDWTGRWDRLIEAIAIIRALWKGGHVSHSGMYYRVEARLYDAPPQPIPLLVAANGPKAMRFAGIHGDGLVTDPKSWKEHKAEWEEGARATGKDPGTMPVLVEQFVVVGDVEEARRTAELWRFIPKAFETYVGNPDPALIQKQAEAEVPIENVISGWVVESSPEKHIEEIEKLFESGATIVNVHANQNDQKKVIDFYGSSVLPKLNTRIH